MSERLRETARRLAVGAGVTGGVGVPVVAWWTEHAPPDLTELGIVVGVVGAGLFAVLRQRGVPTEGGLARWFLGAGREWRGLVLALVLAGGYLAVWNQTTVEAPSDSRCPECRVQVGFGKADWSLNAEGERMKAIHGGASLQQWLMAAGIFGEAHGPDRLWTGSSLMLARGLLFGLFVLAFVVWVAACAAVVERYDVELGGPAPGGAA